MAERGRGAVTDQGTNPGRDRPGTVWNPLGTVPALVLGALMITESSAIACHGKFHHHQKAVDPLRSSARANM
jgi:glutathione S-transferase